MLQQVELFTMYPYHTVGSVIGVVTRYRLDGLRIKSQLGEIFHTCPDRPWVQPILLCNGYWVSSLGVEQPGGGTDHLPSPSTEVKERLELCLSSPSGPSWPVLG
jgi:hypothetical protein